MPNTPVRAAAEGLPEITLETVIEKHRVARAIFSETCIAQDEAARGRLNFTADEQSEWDSASLAEENALTEVFAFKVRRPEEATRKAQYIKGFIDEMTDDQLLALVSASIPALAYFDQGVRS